LARYKHIGDLTNEVRLCSNYTSRGNFRFHSRTASTQPWRRSTFPQPQTAWSQPRDWLWDTWVPTGIHWLVRGH